MTTVGVSTHFGAELDSLSDFVAFGVAPAFLVYLWSLQTAGGFGWALALLFAVCCALRLARFNTALESEGGAAYQLGDVGGGLHGGSPERCSQSMPQAPGSVSCSGPCARRAPGRRVLTAPRRR